MDFLRKMHWIAVPGWCDCGGRFLWTLGFEGWVPICSRCHARNLREAAALIAARRTVAENEPAHARAA